MISARTITDTTNLYSIRGCWDELNTGPNTDFDFFVLINTLRANTISPYVIVVESESRPVALVIGRRIRSDYVARIGYKRIVIGAVTLLEVLYGGVLGCDNPEYAEAALRELRRAFVAGAVDHIALNHIPNDSPFAKSARNVLPFVQRYPLVLVQRHWYAHLPASSEEYLQRLKKKHRHWLRRTEKRLESDFPQQVAFTELRHSEDLSKFMRAGETVAAKTYQRKLSSGFIYNQEFTARFRLQLDKGWLRFYILSIEDKPVAFWVGSVYKNVFFSSFTGYDPAYRDYEVGTLVFVKMVNCLCRDNVGDIDFGLGDALYKEKYGDRCAVEESLSLHAATCGGLGLASARAFLELPGYLAVGALKALRFQQYIKTLWRRRLIATR